MAEYQGFEIFDFLLYAVKRFRILSIVLAASFVFTFACVYLFIEEQYEASAIIIPSEDDAASGLSGMLKGLKNIPINLGKSASLKSEVNRYNTIIYSRTMLEEIAAHFDLYRVYRIDTTAIDHRTKMLKRLHDDIVTKDTDEDAFEILIRSNTPQRSADMVNFVIDRLNSKIIQLKMSKSRENRAFLEKRVGEIYKDLSVSEDSLRMYQERSGLIEIKSQLPEMMTVYGTFESELMTKQLKRNILENLFDKNSPEVKSLDVEIKEYEKKLSALRANRDGGSLVLAMKTLPKTALEYYRRYRQVEINSTVLEFVVPLYEQAKIEEKKDYPILQVIDYAVPPAKKTYPPRLLFSLLGSIFAVIAYFVYDIVGNRLSRSTNPRVLQLRDELRTMLESRKK